MEPKAKQVRKLKINMRKKLKLVTQTDTQSKPTNQPTRVDRDLTTGETYYGLQLGFGLRLDGKWIDGRATAT